MDSGNPPTNTTISTGCVHCGCPGHSPIIFRPQYDANALNSQIQAMFKICQDTVSADHYDGQSATEPPTNMAKLVSAFTQNNQPPRTYQDIGTQTEGTNASAQINSNPSATSFSDDTLKRHELFRPDQPEISNTNNDEAPNFSPSPVGRMRFVSNDEKPEIRGGSHCSDAQRSLPYSPPAAEPTGISSHDNVTMVFPHSTDAFHSLDDITAADSAMLDSCIQQHYAGLASSLPCSAPRTGSLFSTASGRPVHVSDAMLKKAAAILVATSDDALSEKETVKIEEKCTYPDLPSSSILEPTPTSGFLFTTASGRPVAITNAMLKKGAAILAEPSENGPSVNLQSSSSGPATPESVDDKRPIVAEPPQAGFAFSTASGRPVSITDAMLKQGADILSKPCKSEKLAEIEDSSELSDRLNDKSSVFDCTSGDFQPSPTAAPCASTFSEESDLGKSAVYQGFSNTRSSTAGFLFSTASGKPLEITDEMMAKGAALLSEAGGEDATDEHQLATSGGLYSAAATSTATLASPASEQHRADFDEPVDKIAHNLDAKHKTNGVKDSTCSTNSGKENRFPSTQEDSASKFSSRTNSQRPLRNLPHSHPETPNANVTKRSRDLPTASPVSRSNSWPHSTPSNVRNPTSVANIAQGIVTPSPHISRDFSGICLQTPSPGFKLRKRLKFTPPAFRRPVSPLENVPRAPSPKIYHDVPKCNAAKIPLRTFSSNHRSAQSNCKSYLVPNDIAFMTSSAASSYVFPNGKSVGNIRDDCISAGLKPSCFALDWVQNHYRWIVWKLACTERKFRVSALTYDRVLSQVLRRHHSEFVNCKRSALKSVIEGDRSPSGVLILCVASVDIETLSVELTDGWYSIAADLDAGLKAATREGKIHEGLKLRIFNACLTGGSEPCAPLENVDTRLRIFINGTRRALWDSVMGFQPRRGFLISLRSLKPLGGCCPKVRVTILRSLPARYMERVMTRNGKGMSNRLVTRNALGETRSFEEHCRYLEAVEQVLSSSDVPLSGADLLVQLNQSQRVSEEFFQNLESDVKDTPADKLLDILHREVFRRDVKVSYCFLVQSEFPETQPLDERLYFLTISSPEADNINAGDSITVYSVDCASGPFGSVYLNSSPRSTYSVTRAVKPVLPAINVLKFQSRDLRPGTFFDVQGFLVLQSATCIVLCSETAAVELLVLQLGADWNCPTLSVGQFMRVENVVYTRFDSRLNCHSAIGRGAANFVNLATEIQSPLHLSLQTRRAMHIIDPVSCPVPRLQGSEPLSNLVYGTLFLQDTQSTYNHGYAALSLEDPLSLRTLIVEISALARTFSLESWSELDLEAFRALVNGKNVCAWVTATFTQHNVLIAETIEPSEVSPESFMDCIDFGSQPQTHP